MQKTPLLILAGIVLIVGAVWLFNSADTNAPATQTDATESSEPTNQAVADTNATSEAEATAVGDAQADGGNATDAQEDGVAASGEYSTYSADKLAAAETGDVVLFFKADWCPSCRALDTNIQDNLSEIPADVSILTVDYDTETDLKQKYGIVTQHTLVQVDAQGNEIKKWTGSPRLESVLAELN